MRILFIAPLPPPVTGHSLVSQSFLRSLSLSHEVDALDLSAASQHDGTVTLARLVQVARLLKAVWRKSRDAGAIYLTISESVAGNLKDLLIYALCRANLRRLYVHLHGGSIKAELFDRFGLLRAINALFIRKLGGVIVPGPAHLPIFAEMIDERRIHVVANFAHDSLFVTDAAIAAKFAVRTPLRVLYMSSMTARKGYNELADAYLRLPRTVRHRIQLDFAGSFLSTAEGEAFQAKIAGATGIVYHGLVEGAQKQRLLAAAHVFCLPTAHLEGQPVAILEAYASGCVVLTTSQRGIRDVFAPSVNGFEIVKSAESIAAMLNEITDVDLESMALRNRKLAGERYRLDTCVKRLRQIVVPVAA